MNIDSDEFVTLSEAARLLGVSPQRVDTLADRGLLDVVRPWPYVTLIGRRSIAARLAGEQVTRIDTGNTRRWLRTARGDDVVEPYETRDYLRDFIETARPYWDNGRKDLWALNMASTLATRKEPTSS